MLRWIHSFVLALFWLWIACLDSSPSFALANEVPCEEGVGTPCEFDEDEEDEDEDLEEEDVIAVSVKWGTVQTFPANQPEVVKVIENAIQYMDNEVSKPEYDDIRDDCVLLHSNCARWANSGECQGTPEYMLFHCAPICQSCHVLRSSEEDISSPVLGNPESKLPHIWKSLREVSFSLKPAPPVDLRKRFVGKGDRDKMRPRRSREATKST